MLGEWGSGASVILYPCSRQGLKDYREKMKQYGLTLVENDVSPHETKMQEVRTFCLTKQIVSAVTKAKKARRRK